jgi:hypothetical protein
MKQLIIIIVVLLTACSTTRPLIDRGLSLEEREFYIIQNGWGMSQDIKNCFIAGKPIIGMTEEHIFMLFGPPDQKYTNIDEYTEIWHYLTVEKRNLIELLKVTFDKKSQTVINTSGM